MVRFECDTCRRLKQAGEVWILGFGAEEIGVTAARREMSIASAWDDARALDALAVHFCSDECRQDYMDRLFAGEPPTTTIIEEEVEVLPAAAEVERRIVRTVPGGEVETTIRNPRSKKRVKRTSRKAS